MEVDWYADDPEAKDPPLIRVRAGRVWHLSWIGQSIARIERKSPCRPIVECHPQAAIIERVERVLFGDPWPANVDQVLFGIGDALGTEEPLYRFWVAMVEQGGECLLGDLESRPRRAFPPDWLPDHLRVGSVERDGYDLVRLGDVE